MSQVLANTTPGELGELASEAIADILDRSVGTASIATYAESGEPLSWSALAEGGWDFIGVVEDGEGASLRDLVAVAQAWGAKLVPLPLLETVIAKRHSAAARAWDGPVTIALPNANLPDGTGFLPFGQVEGIGVVAALGVGEDSVIVPPAGAENRLDLALRATEAPIVTLLSNEVAQEIVVVLAASVVGAAREMLDLAVAFAKEREQFGKPIGANQAVKHHLANVMIAVEEADSAVIWASIMPESAGASIEFALDRSIEAAEIVLQVHGGLGFTWELGLHFYLRHMLAVREVLQGVDLDA